MEVGDGVNEEFDEVLFAAKGEEDDRGGALSREFSVHVCVGW